MRLDHGAWIATGVAGVALAFVLYLGGWYAGGAALIVFIAAYLAGWNDGFLRAKRTP